MTPDERETTADGAHSTLRWRTARRGIPLAMTEGVSHREIRRREAMFRRGLAIADVISAGIALVAGILLFGDGRLHAMALLGLPLILVAAKAHGLYARDELVVNKTTMDEAPRLFQCATLYTLFVVLLQTEFIGEDMLPIQILGLWGTFFASAVLARRLARYAARRLTPPERCLFVGSHESFERLRSKLPQRDRRAMLVARMVMDGLTGERLSDIGTVTLHRLIEEHEVHRVIIEPSEAEAQATLDFVREAKATGVRVSLLPRILEVVGSAIEVDDVNGITLLGVRRFGLSRSSRLIKRGFDAAGAAFGLIALAPLLLALALLIKRDTRGPVLFRQTRVGRDGLPFDMLKFRTMIDGADKLKPELQADGAGGLFKLADDPRITRVGRWLRRSSLDELPQLVNVLHGEMSLVGPRPLVAVEDEQITGHDRRRLQLTPGMTGHWQIQGERAPLAEMIKLDYLYVAGWSLWGDIKILLRTSLHVFARRGM